MVVWRRTLYCRTGQTGMVAEVSKELARISMDADRSIKACRVYTDLSGRTDRVITEMERDEWTHPRELSHRMHGRTDFLELIQHIVPHIETAEVEKLDLELSCMGSGS